MTRAALAALLAFALAGNAAAAAPPPKAAPAKAAPTKPAAAKPAAKPGAAPAKAPPPSGPFDAGNPQAFMELLAEAGAQTQTNRREEDAVFVTVTSKAAAFSMQFAGCTPQGRQCKAVLLDHALEPKPLTGAQINAFNQSSVMCRLYQAQGGQPHVLYSALLFRTMSRDDAATHLLAWQGCLSDANDFLRDPAGYLANAA